MPVLENDHVRMELDDAWPRTRTLTRRASGAVLDGCDPAVPFALEVNGERLGADRLACELRPAADAVDYVVTAADLGLAITFRFALDAEALVFTVPEVEERGEVRLETLYVPNHRLVSGAARRGDRFLRHVTRRRNWAEAWCPGTATYDQWEDRGTVDGGHPEYGPQAANHACVWNEGVCAAVASSIWVEPLVSDLGPEGRLRPGRGGRFSIWAGPWAYRLRGQPARPLEVRVALLGDYDGNGTIDWCDAANWEGDRLFQGRPNPYRDVLVYKLGMAHEGDPFPRLTFADVLPIVRTIHDLTGGMPQVCYVVGWQYDGHDTGYPSLDKVNPKCGGREAFARLIEDAKALNCTVSLHANYDSCYDFNPEWREDCVSRDGQGHPIVWYSKPQWGGRHVYSMNHTKDFESGFARDRLERLLDLVPIRDTIHLDAFRPYGEAWEPDGTYISAECEVQKGLVPILRMFRDHGVDITTEDTDDEKRGLFHWVWIQADWRHGYKTVMNHGRLLGRGRAGLKGGKQSMAAEGVALGLGDVCAEHARSYQEIVDNVFLYWMYYQLLSRKTMTAYQVGDWYYGVRAAYTDDTRVYGESYPRCIEAVYEGIPIARGDNRFLPWREDVIFAYSVEGGPQEWTLPEGWAGAAVRAETLRPGGPVPGPEVEVDGRTVRFLAPAGMPVRLTRGA